MLRSVTIPVKSDISPVLVDLVIWTSFSPDWDLANAFFSEVLASKPFKSPVDLEPVCILSLLFKSTLAAAADLALLLAFALGVEACTGVVFGKDTLLATEPL